MISLDDLNEIVLDVTGNDFTKANILTKDGQQVDTTCHKASIHIDTMAMIRLELTVLVEPIEETDGEWQSQTLWYTLDEGASFKLTARREFEEGVHTHLPKLISDRIGVSSSEGRRLISQGAVKINGEVVKDLDITTASLANAVVQVGHRRHFEMGEEP